MALKIKNWKLTLLGLVIVCLLASLGFWQLSRSREKSAMLSTFKSRTAQPPVSSASLRQLNDWRFYLAKLTGTFDNKHTLLLDNKTFRGHVGYEVYTPFHADGLDNTILVDRGFTPANINRQLLPVIKPIEGNVTIQGMLNVPPRYVALGDMIEHNTVSWPLRIEYINIASLSALIDQKIYPYLLTLEPTSTYALTASAIDWNIFTVSPERHMAYSFQWFALALTLLVISVVLNRD